MSGMKFNVIKFNTSVEAIIKLNQPADSLTPTPVIHLPPSSTASRIAFCLLVCLRDQRNRLFLDYGANFQLNCVKSLKLDIYMDS